MRILKIGTEVRAEEGGGGGGGKSERERDGVGKEDKVKGDTNI